MNKKIMRIIKSVDPLDVLLVIFLAAASAVGGILTAKFLVFNADATASVYQFQDGMRLSESFVASWHTNLLKIPILILQANLPYNIVTFAIANSILLFAMTLGWALVSAYAFGRRFFRPTVVVLACIVAGSPGFVVETAFTTIRNIEYPLFFLTVVLFWKSIQRIKSDSQPNRSWLIACYLLVTILLGVSDPFFGYVGVPALLAVLAMTSYSEKLKRRVIIWSIGLAVLPHVAAKALIWLMDRLGIFQYYGESMNNTLAEFPKLPTLFWEMLDDLSRLHNANFFGNIVSLNYLHGYLLAILFIASMAGFIYYIRRFKSVVEKSPIFATLLLAGLINMAMYVVLASADSQPRYIAQVTLIISTAFVYTLINYKTLFKVYKKVLNYKLLIVLALVTIAGVLSYGFYAYHKTVYASRYNISKSNMLAISEILKNNNVNTVIAGHSYASTTKFWSDKEIYIVPVLFCNQNLPFLTNESWYRITDMTSDNVAIIYDKAGRDRHSWYCSEERLAEYYGPVVKQIALNGIDNQPIKIFIVPKSAIEKVKIIKQHGKPVPLLVD